MAADLFSQAGLNAGSESAKVADALHFVVRQFDAEMIFQAAEHFECLQAVNTQLLEKVVVRGERAGRHVEVFRRQVEDFLRGLIQCAHGKVNLALPREERKLAVHREEAWTEVFS